VSVALSTIPAPVSLALLTIRAVPDIVSPVEAVKAAKAPSLSSQNTILSALGSAKAVILPATAVIKSFQSFAVIP
jgi:hypothetical protein